MPINNKKKTKTISLISLFKRFRFFIIFFLIGGFCVLIDYAIYLTLWKMTGHIIVPKIVSSIISVSVNYLLNSKFNFNNQKRYSAIIYIQYLLIYAILILLNTGMNALFVHITHNIKISFWISAAIAAFINYFTIKIFFQTINPKK